MSVSPLMDRNRPGPLNSKNQIGFLDVIVMPLFKAFGYVPKITIRQSFAFLTASRVMIRHLFLDLQIAATFLCTLFWVLDYDVRL